ncbi:MAG: undecaprenyl-diphosphatase UppP [Candidatus Daviesbacteria bacterium]
MDFLQAIILSIVEGLTEFLPISSTGHLILASDLLKIPQTEFLKSFEIIIQLGAILAVVFLYFKTLLNFKLWSKILVALLPTLITGLALYKFVKSFLLGNSEVVVIALFLGGIALIAFEIGSKKSHLGGVTKIENLSYKKAFIIGLFQSISIVPGVSRAATTIIGGMFAGLSRKSAVEFSFLLAVPTMMAATSLDLIKSNFSFSAQEYLFLLIGLLGAFITAIIAIKFLIKFVQNHTFTPFGIYRIILATTFYLLIIRNLL